MKKILYTMGIALLLLSSCKEYEMVEYGEGGRLNFLADEAWADDYTGTSPSWSQTADLRYKFNFGIHTQGENLEYDTLLVAVKIMGDVTDQPRRVALKTKPSAANTFEVMFPEHSVVKADTIATVLELRIKRPVGQTTDTAYLVIDYENSDFRRGLEERQEIRLIIQDTVSEKLWGYDEILWASYTKYLGEYSNAKARFLMTLYGCVSFEKWVSKITALGKANRFYADLETYKAQCAADPSKVKFIDENTGEWITFINQAQ